MDISSNSIEHLRIWKEDIEYIVMHGKMEWQDIYPLYSIICFWLNKKVRDSRAMYTLSY